MTQQLAEWVMSVDKHTGLFHSCLTVMANHATEEGEIQVDSTSLARELGSDAISIRKVVAGLLADGSLKRSGDTGQFTIFTPFKSPPAPDSGACVDLTACDITQVNSTEKVEPEMARPKGLTREASKDGTRKRDEVFESVCTGTGIDWNEVTASERAKINKAVKELKEVGATPEMVLARCRVWPSKYPEAVLTPLALAAHWSEMNPQPTGVPDKIYGYRDPEWSERDRRVSPIWASEIKAESDSGRPYDASAVLQRVQDRMNG